LRLSIGFSPNSVTFQVRYLSLSLLNIYVPVRYSENKDCWQTLADILDIFSPSNIILAGDLNLIFEPKEKRGGNSNRDQMLPFVEELFHQWYLLYFRPSKGLYTWTNNRVGVDHISACLDIFLIQSRFLQERRIISSKILPKLTSNKKPILLNLEEEENMGPIIFWFNPLWIEKNGFLETVHSIWSSPTSGSPIFVWENKLKETKHALKTWVKNPTYTPLRHEQETVKKISDLQDEMETKDIFSSDLEKEKTTQRKNLCSFHNEEEYWRLKSRSL
jgi:hypothetical protein